MPRFINIGAQQADALEQFLEAKMPKSLDALVKEVGAENALQLVKLRDRLAERE